MIHLVIGGASSGKSSYAEKLLTQAVVAEKYYIATMPIYSEEDIERVERHHAMRAKKGFHTIECPIDISGCKLTIHSGVILECVTTLVSNEMFLEKGAGTETTKAVLCGIKHLQKYADTLIIVTGDIFADGRDYDKSIMTYMETLGIINSKLATIADTVIELVCGIPLYKKGEVRLRCL